MTSFAIACRHFFGPENSRKVWLLGLILFSRRFAANTKAPARPLRNNTPAAEAGCLCRFFFSPFLFSSLLHVWSVGAVTITRAPEDLLSEAGGEGAGRAVPPRVAAALADL